MRRRAHTSVDNTSAWGSGRRQRQRQGQRTKRRKKRNRNKRRKRRKRRKRQHRRVRARPCQTSSFCSPFSTAPVKPAMPAARYERARAHTQTHSHTEIQTQRHRDTHMASQDVARASSIMRISISSRSARDGPIMAYRAEGIGGKAKPYKAF